MAQSKDGQTLKQPGVRAGGEGGGWDEGRGTGYLGQRMTPERWTQVTTHLFTPTESTSPKVTLSAVDSGGDVSVQVHQL